MPLVACQCDHVGELIFWQDIYWVLGSQEEFCFGVRASPEFSGNIFPEISLTPKKYFPGFSLSRKIFRRFFSRDQFCSGNFSCGAQSHLSGDSNNSTLPAPHCRFSGTWSNAYATDPGQEHKCMYSVFNPRVFPLIFVNVYVTVFAHAKKLRLRYRDSRYPFKVPVIGCNTINLPLPHYSDVESIVQ